MAVDSVDCVCVSFNKCQSDWNSHATTMKEKKTNFKSHACVEIIDFDDDNSINVTRWERWESKVKPAAIMFSLIHFENSIAHISDHRCQLVHHCVKIHLILCVCRSLFRFSNETKIASNGVQQQKRAAIEIQLEAIFRFSFWARRLHWFGSDSDCVHCVCVMFRSI